MEEKKEIKISLSTLLFVLIIVIIGLVSYICIEKSNDKKQMNNSEIGISNFENTDFISNEVNLDNISSGYNKELDINSEIITKLYNYIPCMDYTLDYNSVNAYQYKKATKEDLPQECLLGYAFTQLSLSNSDVELIEGTFSVEDGWYSFDADLLQQKVKELYGENIENGDFEYSISSSCFYENGKYRSSSGRSAENQFCSIREIERAYETDENLYIEDKYIGIDIDDIEKTCKLYTNSQMNNIVKQLNYKDFMKISYENRENEIKNNYGDLMTKYKHTFKKNSDGDYYWYSTEPIK